MQDQIAHVYDCFLQCTGAAIDNRAIQPGQMFFGLPGEKVNGGMFAAQALQNGAAYAVVDHVDYRTDERCLVVEDVLGVMQGVAAQYRNTFTFPVLALTGSNGKTTTKELIAAVLSKKYITYTTKGNLNNHIGVPLTLLNIGRDCTFAVIEMGANHQGEIASYCAYADPDFGLITNIGKAHLEGFGGIEGVLKGKSELFRHIMDKSGVIFWNSGQEKLAPIARQYARTVTYGFKAEDYLTGRLEQDGDFAVVTIDDEVTIHSHLVGSYNAENILAAACIGKYFDVGYADIQDAIEQYIPGNNRSERKEINGNYFIMDAYNANPSSMRAALENFARLEAPLKVVIIGDMLELGEYAEAEHRAILELADQKAFTHVVTVGPQFMALAGGRVEALPDSAAAREWLQARSLKGATILLKGSRGMQLEKVIS